MEANDMADEARRRVLSIGVSRFKMPDLRPLPFASADARAFAEAFEPRDRASVLLDGDATAAALERSLSDLAETATSSDRVIVFVVSHANSDGAGLRLAASDGFVQVGSLLDRLWNGSAARVVLLMDVHRAPGHDAAPSAADLEGMFPARAGRVLLVADSGDHGSHVSGELQAGIWARHITDAFRGAAREADGTLRVGDVKAYLAHELPRSLARAYSRRRQQNPAFIATSDDELLDDAHANAEPDDEGSPLDDVRFFSEQQVPVKSLGGFRKSLHRPPADSLLSSREWVARLAEPDLAKEIDETLSRLRKHLGYKRRDLRADGPAGGAASVLAPDFTYHITISQSPDKPDRATVRRTLAEIRSTDILAAEGLADAFPQGFQSFFRPLEGTSNVATLIDALEDAASPAVTQINYPNEATYCELELAGFDGRVRIDQDSITVTALRPEPPAMLAARFATVRRLLREAASDHAPRA